MSRWVLAVELEGNPGAAERGNRHIQCAEVRDAIGRAAEMVGLEMIGCPTIVPVQPAPEATP